MDQEELPLELEAGVPHSEEVGARPARRARPEVESAPRYRLRNDALASHGCPSGTEIHVDPQRRPARGDIALVTEGGRLKVGVLEVELGRRVLRTDHGSTWLGAGARYVGVVTLVGAPLAGMPDPVS